MDIIKFLERIRHYIKGFIEIASIKTPRYHFVIEKFEISYPNNRLKTKVIYTPVGCYRPFHNWASELNDEMVCRKFKPSHARMLIGIDTLEKNLDFNHQDQTSKYLDYVSQCSRFLNESK